MILKDIAIILVIIFCVYIFYKGIREKNTIKIILPLIMFIIKIRTEIKVIIEMILMLLYFLVVGFLPYILGIIIAVITIFLIKKRGVVKEPELNRIVCIVIVVCSFMSFTLTPLWFEYARARPDETYIEMKKINDNKSLIGLSKKQVLELMGEQKDTDKNVYYYSAGKITNYITGGHRKFYILKVYFDENNIVKSTSIYESD